ncbi:MAG: hypothetical protein U1C56_02375, partial [Candidatus Curtissbacteria bacterium]|nr:hypothetical protein [Candidatus Curtissbacteria bacterium]
METKVETKSEISVSLLPIADKEILSTLVQDFSESKVQYYLSSEPGKIQTEEKLGSESGFTMVGAVDIKSGETSFGKLGYVTGKGGTEHIAQKLEFEDGSSQWVILTFSKEWAERGLGGAFGYYARQPDGTDLFIPVTSAEVDANGNFTGKKWFYDQDTAQFYQILTGTSGNVLASLKIGNRPVIEGLKLMEGNTDTNWNFQWSEDGTLQVVNSKGEVVYHSFDEATGKWFAESQLPPDVKVRFETAGVDLKDMTNAVYSKDGLSITLESGEVVLLTNEELEKNIFITQDNLLQYRDEANRSVIYAFDKETGRWGMEVVKEYPICAPENFRDCEIPVEELF